MTDIIEFLYKIANAPWWVYMMVFAWFCWAVYYNQKREIKNNGLFVDMNLPKDLECFLRDKSDRSYKNGMFSLSEAPGKTGSSEETSGGEDQGSEGEMEVEASGDALVIADAIAGHAGAIHDLADAIRGYAKVMAAENGMDDGEVEDTYLDGTRK